MDLLRQLARGGDDQGADLAARSADQALQDRQDEGRGLAGAGLGQAHDVVSLEGRRDGLLLDGRGLEITDGLDPGRDIGVKIKMAEFP